MNRALLSAIMEQAAVGMCLVGSNGRIVAANADWWRNCSVSRSEAEGRSLLDLSPGHAGIVARAFEKAIATSEVQSVPCPHRPAGGTAEAWESSITPVPVDNGTGFLIAAREAGFPSTRPRGAAQRQRAALRNMSEWHRALMEASPIAVIATDREGNVALWNQAAERMFGWTAAEVLGMPLPYIPEDAREEHQVHRRLALSGERFVDIETRRLRKDGTLLDVSISRAGVFNAAGQVSHIVSFVADITERKKAEEALRRSEAMHRILVESVQDAVNLKDRDGRYLMVNSEHARRLGLPKEEIIGKTPWDVQDEADARRSMEYHMQVVRTGKPLETEREYPGDPYPYVRYFQRIPVLDGSGKVVAVVGVSRDITALARDREALRNQALRDELTGLYNRRGFMALAEHGAMLADRRGTDAALLFLDLDGLKRVNDTYGHRRGDEAIVAAANSIKTRCRSSDIVARLGGDEFVVLAIESSWEAAHCLANRLRDAIADLNRRDWEDCPLSLSIGIVHRPAGSPCSIDEMLDRADALMYEEKRRKQEDL